MSRTAVFIETGLPREEIDAIISLFMREKGFREIDYKGEAVIKKSGLSAVLLVPVYLKVQQRDGGVQIEGWVRSLGEHGLNGRVGLLPKIMLQKAMRGLIDRISPR